MALTHRELLTDILRACYEAAPNPLYPSRFAQEKDVDRADLDRALDELRLKGLVRLTEWVQGLGQGYTLTQAGLDVLENGLRPGAPLPSAPQVALHPDPEVEEPLETPLLARGRPVVTWTLIALNLLVFGGGLAYSVLEGIPASAFLGGDGAALILRQMGSLSARDVLQNGQWWRLVSYAFLHLGLIHLVLNMYALIVLGPLLEAMWGSGRMLLLYLVAAVTGGCVVVWTGRAAVGASGSISGLLGSLAVWVLLNREHLPPALASGLSRMVMINLIILFFLSLSPGVSWEGHLGGAVGGALASFPLQMSRYSDTWPRRVLGFLGTLLVAAVFIGLAAYGHKFGILGLF